MPHKWIYDQWDSVAQILSTGLPYWLRPPRIPSQDPKPVGRAIPDPETLNLFEATP